MRLEPLLKPELVMVMDGADGCEDVLNALAERASSALPGLDRQRLNEELIDRERRIPTSTPEGVAFPHAMVPEIEETIVVPALVRGGVSFGVETHPKSDIVFGMFGCSEKPFAHVRLLARLARIARGPGALDRFRKCNAPEELFEALVAEDRRHA
jgi:PTS system nitrogen regulatory IIA component